MLPSLPQYMIALLKILLAAAPTSKAKTDSINIMTDVLPEEMPMTVMQSMKLGIDVNRHKEIIVKAVSAILLLLLKLIHVVDFKMFKKQQENSRDCLDNDLLVSVDINAKLHGLHDSHRHLLRQHVGHDVNAVGLRLTGGGSCQEDLEESYHVLGEGGEHGLVKDLCRGLLHLHLWPGERVVCNFLFPLNLTLCQRLIYMLGEDLGSFMDSRRQPSQTAGVIRQLETNKLDS